MEFSGLKFSPRDCLLLSLYSGRIKFAFAGVNGSFALTGGNGVTSPPPYLARVDRKCRLAFDLMTSLPFLIALLRSFEMNSGDALGSCGSDIETDR